MNPHNPKISIITSTLNSAKTLPDLIESISMQTFKEFEWVIVDSASDDGTIELLEKSGLVNKLISEKDSGIYEAWNKGLEVANGQYICFIGSDDVFEESNSLQLIANSISEEVDIITARVRVINQYNTTIKLYGNSWSHSDIKKSQNIAHPGALFRSELFKDYGNFKESYKIAGDYEWLLRLNKDVTARFLNKVIIRMGDSGVSNSNLLRVLKETREAQRENLPSSIYRDINFLIYVIRVFLSMTYRKLKQLYR